MLNKLLSLLAFLILVLSIGCIDVIQFDPPDSLGTLVVEGELTNAKISQRVTLKSLSPYGAGPDIPVGGAEVVLISEQGPILGGTFGIVIRYRYLWKMGIQNEMIGLLLCLICG